ncbi:cryptochrome/photolyase family protein [Microlunatus speluncae]|uniref:cryptochrome/photolyase family protein n=1 Tax=Microlunatus speluncae TaxID=2594267 RepID=UPI0012662598|nr:deoxyribodipyrimidine photo-lyase [Microlunatus speluncae]
MDDEAKRADIALMWFRRDLRLADHPALSRAAESGRVLPLVVLDPTLLRDGSRRRDRYLASVAALRDTIGGALEIRTGDPAEEVRAAARRVGATAVHISAETTPFGRRRDGRVRRSLAEAGIELIATGSPYAVGPGAVRNGSGDPYKVFTPFSRAWREHGWADPAPAAEVAWHTDDVKSEHRQLPDPDDHEAGEVRALDRWRAFLDERINDYETTRDRPDLDATSRLSIPLKYGEIHPRTILADVGAESGRGAAAREKFVAELCWREFYADVLWHRPESAWQDLRPEFGSMEYADPDQVADLITAWKQGRTGYPAVDAAMRQLLGEGFMHNRMRMVTASFLAKDLHVWWPLGARHFLDQLLDGDLASNNHNWQWVAGTGTDAAPYFRVFNPITQGKKFDPDGHYVRRWVPELAHLDGAAVHEPWKAEDGYADGYPERIVDHAEERRVALARYEQARS